MYGYIYLSSGAIKTSEPERYPARRDQLRNLRFLEKAAGETIAGTVLEKVPVVTGLDALPKLKVLLVRAGREDTVVVIDDLRRLFYRCPIPQRVPFLKEIGPFLPLIVEVRRVGRKAHERSKEQLEELLNVSGPVRYRAEPKPVQTLPEANRRAQTRRARESSILSRSQLALRRAAQLDAVRSEMLANETHVTNQALAEEANRRGLMTTRGNLWSHATVKRALDRIRDGGRRPY